MRQNSLQGWLIMPFVIEIGAAIAAVASTFITTTAITSAVIGIGLSIATGYIMQALMPKPKSGIDTPGGVQFQRQYGADIPRQVACGLVGIAGHDVYVNTFNPSNRTMQQVYVVSDYYTTGLSRIAIDGEWVTLGTDIGDGKGQPVTSGAKAGFIWVKYFNGHQSSSDGFLTTFANPAGRWGTDYIGVGLSFVSILLEFDKDNNNSFPDFFFEVMGAPLYDWRKDDTAGGSGAHRWNDVATHEYSTNPIVIEYNYRRGFSVNGDLFCGMGMPSTDLPLVKWTDAANICSEDVDGNPRYACSIVLNCMAFHSDNLRSLALSCGAMQIDGLDGSWPLVGSDQPSVMTFTDEDIISVAENFKRTEKRSMSELVNSVAGNYPEPDQLWSMIGYEPQISATHLVLDRRTRDVAIDFPQVPNGRQAAQLASIYLYENRYEVFATVTLRPRFQVLEAGDWVDWNSARYGNKTFIITSKQLISLEGDGPRNVVLGVQERDGAIYDGITPPVPTFPTPPDAPDYLAEVDSFAAVPVLVTGSTGVVRAAIRASWDTIDDVTVTAVDILYYPTGDATSIIHKTVSFDQTVVTLVEGVVGSTEYRVQAKLITSPARVTTYNAGVLVTTVDAGSVGLGDLDAEIRYQLIELQNLNNERLNTLENLIASTLANQDGRNWLDKKEVRYQLDATAGGASAAIEELRLVVVDNQTAFANYQITVSASFDDVDASVAVNASAIATINGYAAAQYSVTLNVDGYATGFNLINGGGGLSEFTVVSDKFKIQLPGYNGNDPINVFTIGTIDGDPAIGINGNVFLDGTINAVHMNVSSLSAISADIGAVTAGTLSDPAGTTMLIDLTNGRILIKQ
jgi:hypothetical protein